MCSPAQGYFVDASQLAVTRGPLTTCRGFGMKRSPTLCMSTLAEPLFLKRGLLRRGRTKSANPAIELSNPAIELRIKNSDRKEAIGVMNDATLLRTRHHLLWNGRPRKWAINNRGEVQLLRLAARELLRPVFALDSARMTTGDNRQIHPHVLKSTRPGSPKETYKIGDF